MISQVYNIEVNKIYCENCLDTMKRMPDGYIDLVVTSPPYDNLRDYKGYSFPFEEIAKELFRVVKIGGVVVWVVADATINGSETGTSFRQALFFMECGFKLHDTMIYDAKKPPLTHNRYEQSFEYMFVLSKGGPSAFNGIMEAKAYEDKRTHSHMRREKDGSSDMGYSKQTTTRLKYNIFRYATGGGLTTKDEFAFQHPAMFPEQLAADHIYSWSNAGYLVYDPFMGSGTTGKMAMLMDRNYIGSEMSSEYVAIAEKRIALHKSQTKLF